MVGGGFDYGCRWLVVGDDIVACWLVVVVGSVAMEANATIDSQFLSAHG